MRLPHYNYGEGGAYMVTICTQNRETILGRIVGKDVATAQFVLSELGNIVQKTWDDLPNHTTGVELGPFVIMPDHVHGIILLHGRAGLGPAPTALQEVVRQFKAFSARRINALRSTTVQKLWQRGYYEHVIRNDRDYLDCAQYILENPAAGLAALKTETR
jgi:REP element-mobilizing transposase RayT